MGSRLKEDEKREKLIRSLSKREENRRCINCCALGPQYVCTNFSTFVCTQCSGVHREFTHRVKSISMAKFTAAEVSDLQAGGNQRCRESFLKSWDPQRHPLPDSSRPEKLRDFIKAVYVDRRYAGDIAPQRGKQGDKEDTSCLRKSDNHSDTYSVPQSPSYEDQLENRRYGNRPLSRGSDGGRYEDRGLQYDDTRSPGRFVPGRGRYDRSERERQFEDSFTKEGVKSPGRFDNNRSRPDRRTYSEGDRRFEERIVTERREPRDPRQANSRPPVYRDYSSESFPSIRSVREALGDESPGLRVEENVRSNGRIDDARGLRSQGQPRKDLHTLSFGSSANGGSIAGSDTSLERADSWNLIDVSADLDIPAAAVQSDPFGVTSLQTPPQSGSTGWATFDMTTSLQKPETGVEAPAEFADSFRTSNCGVVGSNTVATTTADSWSSTLQWSSGNTGMLTHASDKSLQLLQQTGIPLAHKPPAPDVAVAQISENQKAGNVSVPNNSRSEIHEDLFNSSFAQASFPSMGMQMGQHFPLGSALLGGYAGGGAQGYGQRPKSKNPFDFSEEAAPVPTGGFPNMTLLQSALPTLPIGTSISSGLGAANPQWSQPAVINQPPIYFPPLGVPGVSGYYNQQPSNFLPPVLQQHQYPFTLAPRPDQFVGYQHAPQNFMTTPGSAVPQSSIRPVGRNPFD